MRKDDRHHQLRKRDAYCKRNFKSIFFAPRRPYRAARAAKGRGAYGGAKAKSKEMVKHGEVYA